MAYFVWILFNYSLTFFVLCASLRICCSKNKKTSSTEEKKSKDKSTKKSDSAKKPPLEEKKKVDKEEKKKGEKGEKKKEDKEEKKEEGEGGVIVAAAIPQKSGDQISVGRSSKVIPEGEAPPIPDLNDTQGEGAGEQQPDDIYGDLDLMERLPDYVKQQGGQADQNAAGNQ